MRYEFGDMLAMWERADLYLVTGNTTLTHEGKLVMRSPSAKAVTTHFVGHDIAGAIGAMVSTFPVRKVDRGHTVYHDYGLLVSPAWPKAKLGLFQTRRHFSDPVDGKLLSASVEALGRFTALHAGVKVHLAFPGLSDGKLEWWWIEPYLERLPDNVTVWRERAPYVPEIRLVPGTPEYTVAHGPGQPNEPLPTRETMTRHFYDTLATSIPRYQDRPEAAELEFGWLFSGWGREWWQRVAQYRTVKALATLLDSGEERERAIGNAFQTARNFYEEKA